MEHRLRRLRQAISSAARLVAVAVAASAVLSGCGGGGSSAKTTATEPTPPELAGAETSRFCRGLGPKGCAEINTEVEQWLAKDHLSNVYAPGALALAVSGCLNCHTYQKSGNQTLKAPDLTSVGGSLKQEQILAELNCPACVHPGSKMPSYRSLSPKVRRQLAAFLAASH